MEPRKEAICEALSKFIRQRPGLEFGNYGGVTSYRSECRDIARDKREAETLLAAVRWRDSISADALIQAAKHAYSGRLTIVAKSADPKHQLARIEYCTGQYFPTEYRKAVCAVLAAALWDYTRNLAMPPVTGYRVESWHPLNWQSPWLSKEAAESSLLEKGGQNFGHINEGHRDGSQIRTAGDWLRSYFAREFGRGLASRWFR